MSSSDTESSSTDKHDYPHVKSRKSNLRRKIKSFEHCPQQTGTRSTTSASGTDTEQDCSSSGFRIPRVPRRKLVSVKRKVSVSDEGMIQCTVSESETETENSESTFQQLEPELINANETVFSVGSQLWDKLEAAYYQHRPSIVSPEGFLSTPLHMVKSLSEAYRTPYHAEVFVLSMKHDKVFRVELFIGEIRGIGQSPRRKLSFQLAAADLMDKMGNLNDPKVQPFGVLPGLRVNPSIFGKLTSFCFQNSLDRPKLTLIKQRPYSESPMFVIECRIGKLNATGESDCRFMAKRLAAKAMYEKIAGVKVAEDFALIGNECFGLHDLHQRGIPVSFSHWKKEWLEENRIKENKLTVQEDEPDDRIMEEEEDSLEFGSVESLPDQKWLMGIRRIICNN